jgi:AcrR family transcriptional regulator
MENNKAKKYFSRTMGQRRQKILRTARKLIGEHGIDGFAMKELALAAGVSSATLFNIYGNRENLVSQAVLDAFNTSVGKGISSTPETIEELIHYLEWTHEEIIKLGNYIPVIVNSYFSSAGENRIREILLREASAPYIHFLRKHADSEIVRNTETLAEFGEMISNQIFSFMRSWAAGEIDSAQLGRKLRIAVFTLVIPVVEQSPRDELIREELKRALRNSLGNSLE